MLQRNQELRRAFAAAVAITAVFAVAAPTLKLDGPLLALAFIAHGAALAVIFAALTRRRYRALATMAARVDESLHTGRAVSLADMREGELAILSNEIDKALTRLTLAAEELSREKLLLADSLADISHQLRTPLTSMGLTLALARREAQALDAVQANVAADGKTGLFETNSQTVNAPTARPEASQTSAESLLSRIRTCEQLLAQVQWLVEALLKLARIDAETVEPHQEHVEASSLVEAAMAPLAISYELAGVALERSVQPGAGFVGDAAWTAEALGNLLKNCLEHTPAGGTVRVEASEDNVACRIRVSDTGPGIAEEDLPHVFERFWQGRERAKNDVNPKGVGIGLSLARSIVTAQGGRLTAGNAHDEQGRVVGAQFDVTFFKAVV